MNKIIVLIFVISLSQCWLAPTTQRDNCYTEEGRLYGGLDTTCGIELLLWSYGANTTDNSIVDGMYYYSINECLKALKFEEKCRKTSPYIPDWPAEN